MVVPEEHQGKLLKLEKGLYGTKQGGCCWFVQVMEGIGFSVSFYDDSFYHLNRGSDTILVWIHVDDGSVTVSSESVMRFFQHELESKLKNTWDGKVHLIVGIKPDEDVVNPNGYLSIVGSLNYLAIATRPDLSFAVGFLSRFSKSPTTHHWSAVQNTLWGQGICKPGQSLRR
ncbi:uncharacterized protein VP01_6457g1 [Puccinia sorghi]|uniref:Reverse transcriptase Ty1/copia-type domain-containing protein n=1 Tax=Puccinia sorghi TaxID=27349 RepID=A0A0L6UHV7_9BASI|nr:uncharacterized protein VP01_6457g1 [Puccinia sorghi]